MEIKIRNEYGISKEEITNQVTRVKALIINSKNEILFGYSSHIYQLIGGHLEEGEDIKIGLQREIKEESGILVPVEWMVPLMLREDYRKNEPQPGENRLSRIFYYKIETDDKINRKQTQYTQREKEGNFELKYVSIEKAEEILKENASIYPEAAWIAMEIIEVLQEYKKQRNKA